MHRIFTKHSYIVLALLPLLWTQTAAAQSLAQDPITLPPPAVPDSREAINTPFKDCAAYQQLLQDIKDLQIQIKHNNFAYGAQEKIKVLRAELKVLKRADQRLSGFYFGSQPGCPLPATMRGPGAVPQHVGTNEIYCIPKLKLSDDLVKAVRWSEETQYKLKKTHFGFGEVEHKRSIERAIAQTEKALHKLAVPAGLYRQYDTMETVDPVYYTPNKNNKFKQQKR